MHGERLNELSGRVNYRPTTNRVETFGRLVIGEIDSRAPNIRALDIGCGKGINTADPAGRHVLDAIRSRVSELWGVEPDASVVPNPTFDRFVRGTLEEADLPEAYFDVAFAHYVVEHVESPVEFLKKAHSLLRPGGCFVFITPNSRHYFARTTRFLRGLRLEDAVLRWLRGSAAHYHYPTQYLLNDARTIESLAIKAGFRDVKIAYFEHGDVRPYFPGVLRFIPIAIEKMQVRSGDPSRLCGLAAVLTR
jgi:SAM-dependent methyltransferase